MENTATKYGLPANPKINVDMLDRFWPSLSESRRYAIVKYGGGIVQMSGSIAGDTHARNRFGNYIRARTTPVNPMSSRQTTVRARVQLIAEAWKTELTAAQRLAWETYAAAISWTNHLGESVKLTGFNHFMRSNLAKLQISAVRAAAGPTVLSLPVGDPTFSVVLSVAAGITFTFDDTLAWASETGAWMFVHIGQPQPATRTFFGGPYRFANVLTGDTAIPITSPQGPLAVTAWTLVVGQRVWVKANIFRADGRMSVAFVANDVLVVA